jgi:NAD-dependent SIR2 family protein deacetylase
MEADLEVRIQTCAEWIAASHRLVVFTGAGISTDSGLPDFRGPDGVWTRRDKGLPPPETGVRWSQVEPNLGHRVICELQEMGKLDFLISQNVDNLHLKSGIRPEIISELHGNMEQMKCLACDRRFTKEQIGWDDSKWGEGRRNSPVESGQPACACGGRIISSVVHFGDPMPEKDLGLAMAHAQQCDLFLVVGSSLVVTPAAQMPLYALEAGARLVIINQGETPFDAKVHLRFWEGIGEVLPPVVDRVKEIVAVREK